MDETTARSYLAIGLARINEKRPAWERRENYYRGDQDLPYAPPGVNAEYLSLREMSVANWLALAMDAPVQRLRVDGFRTGREAEADMSVWQDVWQSNRLDARQRVVYTQMVVHGRGLMSVWPNRVNKARPIIRPESTKRVHVEMDPEDPFTVKWAVKTFTIAAPPPSALILPDYLRAQGTDVAIAYDATHWARFEKQSVGSDALFGVGDWALVDGGPHSLGEPPFVTFDNRQDADGCPQSGIEPLMPAQDAINTIRFLTLLAMQFSGYRQRVFTGYDPVVKDKQGNVLYQKEDDGATLKLGPNGQPLPVLNSPGRIGVDRALVFPGAGTKVFDMPESNLDNYITVLGEFLTQLFAIGQVPPQYLLSRMANLSGDALTGAESTLASLVTDLQRWVGESLEQVMRLAGRARGDSQDDIASEVIWADAEARSFAQVIDAITKLVSTGFPREGAYEMIPGATPQKVQRWMDMIASEALDPAIQQILSKAGPGADNSLAGV